jgi:hypothetical protein
METMQCCAVMNQTEALGLRFVAKGKATFVAYRQIWLEGWDFETLRRIADCILFYLEVTGSAAYPCILWERAESFDIRWCGELPAELADKAITVAGMPYPLRAIEGRVRVA